MSKAKTRPHSITFTEKSQTRQEFKRECDINHIVKNLLAKGLDVPDVQGIYMDATANDYQEHMDAVASLRSDFNQLPAEFRRQLNDDPLQYLEYLQENHQEVASGGLRDLVRAAITPQRETPAQPETSPEGAQIAQNAPETASPEAE